MGLVLAEAVDMLFEDCTLDVTKGVLDDGDGGVGATTVELAVRTMSGQEAAAYTYNSSQGQHPRVPTLYYK